MTSVAKAMVTVKNVSLLIHFLLKQTLEDCLVPDSQNWQYNEFFFLNVYAAQPVEFNLTKNVQCKVAMWMNSFFVRLLKMGAPKKNQKPIRNNSALPNGGQKPCRGKGGNYKRPYSEKATESNVSQS